MSVNIKKTAVFFHAHCLDGYAAAWAAWSSLGDNAYYVAVNHHEPLADFSKGDRVYILDFCYPIDLLVKAAAKAEQIIVIDHHISAQKSLETYQGEIPENLTFNFNMQQSGCMMAWNYFQQHEPPKLLQHIQDNDLWAFELPYTKEITRALFLRQPLAFSAFADLSIKKLRREGKLLQKQHRHMIKILLNSRHSIKLDNITGLAVNAPSVYASDLGHALAELSGTFGVTYHYHGKRQCYECGIRSIDSFDVSTIAVSLGGGGHKNASGFKLNRHDFWECVDNQ